MHYKLNNDIVTCTLHKDGSGGRRPRITSVDQAVRVFVWLLHVCHKAHIRQIRT